MQLEESLTLEKPWIYSELVKAQILSLFCWVYCVQLRNVLFDHHRLHGCHHHFPPRHCSHNHPRRSRWPSFSSRKVLELRPNQDADVTVKGLANHLCPEMTVIRCTLNFDIQHEVSLKV